MDLVAAPGQLEAEFGRHGAGAAVGGITGDADLHESPPFPCGRRSPRRARLAGGSRRARAPARELVAEPGLLPLGVLPGADGDRLGQRSRSRRPAGTPPPPDADAVEPRRSGGCAFRQHRSHLLDQAAPHHLRGAARDPLVQDRPGHGEPTYHGGSPPCARALRCHQESGRPVSSAISMARAARCRPPPTGYPGSRRQAQRTRSRDRLAAITAPRPPGAVGSSGGSERPSINART